MFRCVRHNITDKDYDDLAAAHDIYRKTLTANRIALYPTTIAEIVMDWGRGVCPKYAAQFDTILRWMIVEGRYYVHGSFACVGKATFDPVRLDMCVFLSLNVIEVVNAPIQSCCDMSFGHV